MGRYDKSRFKQLMVTLDIHSRLAAMKRVVTESFSGVLQRLLDKEEKQYAWSVVRPVQPEVQSFWSQEGGLFA